MSSWPSRAGKQGTEDMAFTFLQKWHAYVGMSKRNVLVYFKDRVTVFFSLLAPLIVLVLYMAFLRDMYVSSVRSSLSGLEDYVSEADIGAFVNAWLVAGLLGSSLITVSLNSLSVMVDDKYNHVDSDYRSSPVNGPLVVLSYFTGAFLATVIVGALLLSIGLGVMALLSPFYLSGFDIAILYLLVLLGSASSTLFMMIVVSFFKKSSALGAFSGLVSAAVGFIIGAYMPMSTMAEPVQLVCNAFPGSSIAGLFRNYRMSGSLEHMESVLDGQDSGQFIIGMKEAFSFELSAFGTTFGIPEMFYYASAFTLACLFVNIFFYRFSSQRK
jgi:multidrug/hemolysin transport system permease protein